MSKQTVSSRLLVSSVRCWSECGENVFQRWLNMTLVNYVLVGLLGTIVGIALYMAKVDFSQDSKMRDLPVFTDLS